MKGLLKKRGKGEWKRCILELPDDLFFSIMRTYLGEIQTPFHKPRLVDRLGAFLTEDETLRRIIALIDRSDAEILTALELLEKPDAPSLYRFFEEEREYFNFHNHLINLQERLLIYTCPESGELHLNPYIAPEIREKVLSAKLIFPPGTKVLLEEKNEAETPSIPVTEELSWAIVSFLLHHKDLFKNDGTFRKKTMEQLRKSFPELIADRGFAGIYLQLRGLISVGLLTVDFDTMQTELQRNSSFGRLSRPLRLCALWSAMALAEGDADKKLSPTRLIPAEKLEEFASHLLRFFDMVPERTLFSPAALNRLLFISGVQEHIGVFQSEGQPGTMILRLADLKILIRRGDCFFLNPDLSSIFYTEANLKPLLLHPDFSVTVKPPLTYAGGVFLAGNMEISNFGTYPQFTLTGDSFLYARDIYSFEQIRDKLSEFSESEIPQNIRFSLQSWENNYSSVLMIEGIILILADHWNRLVLHHPEFKLHVLRDLDNGIYVMDPETKDSWRALLEEIGVSPLPPVQKSGAHTSAVQEQNEPQQPFPQIHGEDPSLMDLTKDFPREDESSGEAERIQQELAMELELMETNSGEKKELNTRIDHKLYLFPFQLRYPVLSDAASEARGIDYAGKVRVIQQALQSKGALLELVERTGGGKPARHLVKPIELRKLGNDLVLRGKRLPLEDELEIRVEKIGYVKKWKSSLFIQPNDYTQT